MDTKKTVRKQLLAAILTVCFVLPVFGCKEKKPTEAEQLVKLCRVWGYVKYTHPAFLLGEKDWDEELLALIPQVREKETSAEVNALSDSLLIKPASSAMDTAVSSLSPVIMTT